MQVRERSCIGGNKFSLTEGRLECFSAAVITKPTPCKASAYCDCASLKDENTYNLACIHSTQHLQFDDWAGSSQGERSTDPRIHRGDSLSSSQIRGSYWWVEVLLVLIYIWYIWNGIPFKIEDQFVSFQIQYLTALDRDEVKFIE